MWRRQVLQCWHNVADTLRVETHQSRHLHSQHLWCLEPMGKKCRKLEDEILGTGHMHQRRPSLLFACYSTSWAGRRPCWGWCPTPVVQFHATVSQRLSDCARWQRCPHLGWQGLTETVGYATWADAPLHWPANNNNPLLFHISTTALQPCQSQDANIYYWTLVMPVTRC